jgi:hypothetical protein
VTVGAGVGIGLGDGDKQLGHEVSANNTPAACCLYIDWSEYHPSGANVLSAASKYNAVAVEKLAEL